MPKSNSEDYDYLIISRPVNEYYSSRSWGTGEDEFCSAVHAYIQRGYKCAGGITVFRERVHQAMVKG